MWKACREIVPPAVGPKKLIAGTVANECRPLEKQHEAALSIKKSKLPGIKRLLESQQFSLPRFSLVHVAVVFLSIFNLFSQNKVERFEAPCAQ